MRNQCFFTPQKNQTPFSIHLPLSKGGELVKYYSVSDRHRPPRGEVSASNFRPKIEWKIARACVSLEWMIRIIVFPVRHHSDHQYQNDHAWISWPKPLSKFVQVFLLTLDTCAWAFLRRATRIFFSPNNFFLASYSISNWFTRQGSQYEIASSVLHRQDHKTAIWHHQWRA